MLTLNTFRHILCGILSTIITSMGIELNRISQPLIEELLCELCLRLPEEAVVISGRNCLVCKKCIEGDIRRQKSNRRGRRLMCPIDGRRLSKVKYRTAPRIVRNILDEIRVQCKYESNGCQQMVTAKDLPHQRECQFRECEGED